MDEPRETSSSAAYSATSSCPSAGSGARQTPLVLDSRMRPFYDVSIKAISVDGEFLKIPHDVWEVDNSGGVILDSGTSLTVLAKPAYRAVVAALNKKLAGFPRVNMDPFKYCYGTRCMSGGRLSTRLKLAGTPACCNIGGAGVGAETPGHR